MPAMNTLVEKAVEARVVSSSPFQRNRIQVPPAETLKTRFEKHGMSHVLITGVHTQLGGQMIAPSDLAGAVSERLVTCKTYMDIKSDFSLHDDNTLIVQLMLLDYPGAFRELQASDTQKHPYIKKKQ
jgi:hypothetical protein